MKNEDSGNGNKVIVIMTDAGIDSFQIKELRNKATSEDAKVIFIGIDAKLSGDSQRSKDARFLFGENNITLENNPSEVLKRAFMEAI